MCLAQYFSSSNKLFEKKIIFRVKSSGDIPIYQALQKNLPEYLIRIASSFLEADCGNGRWPHRSRDHNRSR